MTEISIKNHAPHVKIKFYEFNQIGNNIEKRNDSGVLLCYVWAWRDARGWDWVLA